MQGQGRRGDAPVNLACKGAGLLEVRRPDGCAEAVLGAVDALQQLGLVLVAEERHDGAERLLDSNLAVVRRVVDERGRGKEAVARRGDVAAGERLVALRLDVVDCAGVSAKRKRLEQAAYSQNSLTFLCCILLLMGPMSTPSFSGSPTTAPFWNAPASACENFS